MNFFHIKDTPFRQEFLEAELPVLDLKKDPDMGLPTQEDSNVKQSMWSMLKEKNRMKKLQSDNPKYQYLCETVGNCLRCLHVETPHKIKEGTRASPMQLEDHGFVLNDQETTLIMPQADFIEKFMCAATKPRAMVTLAKGYLNWSFFSRQNLDKMWETVCMGLRKYDYNKLRPFLCLF